MILCITLKPRYDSYHILDLDAFLYVIPYSLMVGQLGSVFNKEGAGLALGSAELMVEFLGLFYGLDLLGCFSTLCR